MNLSRFILNRFAALLRVPAAAVDMLRAAASISALEKNSLPTELLPLNALQFSRGILNFSFFQSNLRWVFPYWAVRQYDPRDCSFIPRAHLGLSMNLTHRNWTAVGNPECPTEPIVDPRGLVTPFRDGWSIDVWIEADGTTHYPSHSPARQYLHEHYPIVITEFSIGTIVVRLTTFVDHSELFHSARVVNNGPSPFSGSLLFALRPFNPEGVGMITSLSYDEGQRLVIVNGRDSVILSGAPPAFWCSNYRDGDAAWNTGMPAGNRSSSECDAGFANGFFRFPLIVGAGDQAAIDARVPLDHERRPEPIGSADPTIDRIRNVTMYWDELLRHGAAVETPDPALTASVAGNLITLLMLCDGETITPGPASYHHFWFRDAAYMVHALDSFGHHAHTRPIIGNFFSHLEADGYFRSQKGEWDSNGQALWVMHEHVLLTGSDECARQNFPALLKAVHWIDTNRRRNPADCDEPHYGLMPAGLSAEHLGLADHYYWDNFWSLAGVRSFAALCSFVSAYEDQRYAQAVFDEYINDVEQSLRRESRRLAGAAIPAAPGREIDCGIIGSLCALYPLQLFELERERLEATVAVLMEKYCLDDLFFQHFIHSGKNIYLSLQLAHSFLLLGDREKFWRILSSVRRHASPTGTFPEAIHPFTGGGSMGDGHHGWAAAEFVLAVRAMFVLETAHEVRFLSGAPAEWFEDGKTFSLRNAPTHSGQACIAVYNNVLGAQIIIDWEPHDFTHHVKWLVVLPYRASAVTVDGAASPFHITAPGETEILLAPGSCTIIAKR